MSDGTGASPEVTIGIPVFNGANFLADALESATSQVDVDLEIVVVDNGSTDETLAIAEKFAAVDDRIRIDPTPENRGASYSFNRCVELARGTYFRWAAHDDVFDPTFTRRCIDALEADPGVSVAVTQANMIDEHGDVVEALEDFMGARGDDAVQRGFDIMMDSRWCLHIFGVVRTEELRSTGLIGGFAGSDHITLLEFALRGRYVLLDGREFGNREHQSRSVRAYGENRERDRDHWFDPLRNGDLSLPRWRRFIEYGHGVRRAPLSTMTKLRMFARFPRVMLDGHNRKPLMTEPLGYVYRRAAMAKASLRR